jgi:hypothetical protein
MLSRIFTFSKSRRNSKKTADRDCFATPRNARCTAFFTSEEDALKQNWETGEILWINPPWSLWPKVVRKLRKNKCDAICVCPDWEKGWVKDLLRRATKKLYFPAGTPLFELNGQPMEGVKWGVWALLVEGTQPQGNGNRQQPKLVKLKSRFYKKGYPARKIRKLGKDRQLLMCTNVEFLNGEEKTIHVLVGTEAEGSLIGRGLVGEHLVYAARTPLRLETAKAAV